MKNVSSGVLKVRSKKKKNPFPNYERRFVRPSAKYVDD